MPERAPVTADTVQRLAREVAGLSLSDSEITALVPLLNALFAEVAALDNFPCDEFEPSPQFSLTRWAE